MASAMAPVGVKSPAEQQRVGPTYQNTAVKAAPEDSAENVKYSQDYANALLIEAEKKSSVVKYANLAFYGCAGVGAAALTLSFFFAPLAVLGGPGAVFLALAGLAMWISRDYRAEHAENLQSARQTQTLADLALLKHQMANCPAHGALEPPNSKNVEAKQADKSPGAPPAEDHEMAANDPNHEEQPGMPMARPAKRGPEVPHAVTSARANVETRTDAGIAPENLGEKESTETAALQNSDKEPQTQRAVPKLVEPPSNENQTSQAVTPKGPQGEGGEQPQNVSPDEASKETQTSQAVTPKSPQGGEQPQNVSPDEASKETQTSQAVTPKSPQGGEQPQNVSPDETSKETQTSQAVTPKSPQGGEQPQAITPRSPQGGDQPQAVTPKSPQGGDPQNVTPDEVSKGIQASHAVTPENPKGSQQLQGAAHDPNRSQGAARDANAAPEQTKSAAPDPKGHEHKKVKPHRGNTHGKEASAS